MCPDADQEWLAELAPMHLAHITRVIQACKPSIRREYLGLFAPEGGRSEGIVLEEFERLWTNWNK